MWSTMPTPWRQPASAQRSISSTRPSRSPSSATGTPRSNSTRRSCVLVRARPAASATSSNTSSRGGSARSSIGPPSDERPQMLSSIEYGGRLACRPSPGCRARARRRSPPRGPSASCAPGATIFIVGVEREHGRLDPHLVVALAGAAVGDGVAAVLARLLHRELGDQRPAERGEQRVAAAVAGVGLDRRAARSRGRTPRGRRPRRSRARPRSSALPRTTSKSSPGWPRFTVAPRPRPRTRPGST